MGSTFEGLMYSLVLTARDILKGNFDKTPIERKRRAMLAIHDLFMGLLIAMIVKVLLEDFDSTDESPEGQVKQLTGKAFYKAMNEFNPFDSVFNAFK